MGNYSWALCATSRAAVQAQPDLRWCWWCRELSHFFQIPVATVTAATTDTVAVEQCQRRAEAAVLVLGESDTDAVFPTRIPRMIYGAFMCPLAVVGYFSLVTHRYL